MSRPVDTYLDNSVFKSGRQSWLDIVRIMACIMVIMMHSIIIETDHQSDNFAASISYLMAPCNGLFFMVSGALLIKPQNVELGLFLRKRIVRILPPLVTWSLIYILLRYWDEELGLDYILKSIVMLPFTAQGCGYFWFLYVLMGCYVMIPVWSSWLINSSNRALIFILILWFTSSFIPLILHSFPFIEEYNSWMYYFAGFMGYFLLGYYISKRKREISWRIIVYGFVITITLLCVHFYVHPEINPKGRLYCYLQPYVISACYTVFCLCRKVFYNWKSHRITKYLSEATFGIYLSQSLVLNYFLKRWELLEMLNPIVGFLIRVILTFVICFFLVVLINKTPLRRFLSL